VLEKLISLGPSETVLKVECLPSRLHDPDADEQPPCKRHARFVLVHPAA
jgi:hypothetical protein